MHCASALNFPVGDLKMHFASALDFQLWLQHRVSSCNSSYINLTGDSADLCATEIYYRIALILICCVQGFNQCIRFSAYLATPVGNPCDELVHELLDCVPCGLRVMTCADVARGCIEYSRNEDQTFAE